MYIYGKKQSKNKITSLHEMNYMTFTINDLWSSRQYQLDASTYVLEGFQWKKYGVYKEITCIMLSIRAFFFLEKVPSLSFLFDSREGIWTPTKSQDFVWFENKIDINQWYTLIMLYNWAYCTMSPKRSIYNITEIYTELAL